MRKKFTTYIEEESIAWLKREALKREIATGSKVTAADIINELIEKERKPMEKTYIMYQQYEGETTVIEIGTETEICEVWNRDAHDILPYGFEDDEKARAIIDTKVSSIEDLQALGLDWSWYRLEVAECPPTLTAGNLHFAHEATNGKLDHSDLEFELDGVKYLIRDVPAPEGWDGESDWTDDDDYIDQVAHMMTAEIKE